MVSFPTLSSGRYLLGRYRKTLADDPAIVSPTEAGYEITRARYTRHRYQWEVTMIVDGNDKQVLEDFVNSVKGGSDQFTWTDPATGQEHEVRFYRADEISWIPLTPDRWMVSFVLREV